MSKTIRLIGVAVLCVACFGSPHPVAAQDPVEPEPAVPAQPPPPPPAEPAPAEPEPAEQAEPEPAEQAEPEPAEQAEPEPAEQAEPEPAEQAEPEPAEQAEPEPVEPAEPQPAETAEPAEPAPLEPAEPAQLEPAPLEETNGKRPFALYLSASVGLADSEPLNTSTVIRQSIDQTTAEFTLPDQLHSRAAIGWKLARQRGDFRVAFTGYKEDSYEVTAVGESVKLLGSTGVIGPTATDFVGWWHVNVEDGSWVAYRTPRSWNALTDDANGSFMAEPEEVQVGAVDRMITATVPESMNNSVQTYDFLYGREFGGRRYSSRWWGGLRYFDYSGQVVVPTWLGANGVTLGTGFTDQAFLSPLLFEEDSSGWGPTGIWEVHFNFFEKRLVLYLGAQTAFLFSDLETDSGQFFTLLTSTGLTITPSARLHEERSKSVWQNTGEFGARWNMRNGVGFEVGYSLTGYLDAVLLPHQLIVPEAPPQAESGTSALYSTQDYEVDGWHFGASFQF
jgi:hypothetical protein